MMPMLLLLLLGAPHAEPEHPTPEAPPHGQEEGAADAPEHTESGASSAASEPAPPEPDVLSAPPPFVDPLLPAAAPAHPNDIATPPPEEPPEPPPLEAPPPEPPEAVAAPLSEPLPSARNGETETPASPSSAPPEAPADHAAAEPPPSALPAAPVEHSTRPTSPDWLLNLLTGADEPETPSPEPSTEVLLFPEPSDLLARGPEAAWHRFLWLLASLLVARLALTASERRPPGRVRLQLVRLVAVARSVAVLAGLGAAVALLPVTWLPWLGVVAVSMAIAFGWSMRPLVNDGLSGLYLGILGRHGPGTTVRLPDTRATIHSAGPLRTLVRTESGALRTVPNRELIPEAHQAGHSSRTAVMLEVTLAPGLNPREGLAAIQWACALLPWTAAEPARVRPPRSPDRSLWTVELVVLGRSPPLDELRAVFSDLVCEVLQCGEPEAAPSSASG